MFIHNFISKAICTEYTDFCLQLCFSEKGETTLIHQTFQILKMKAHFKKEPHFGNEMVSYEPYYASNASSQSCMWTIKKVAFDFSTIAKSTFLQPGAFITWPFTLFFPLQ